MNNPTCATCLNVIQSLEDSTVGMFFDKFNGRVEVYCLCGNCTTKLAAATPDEQAVLRELIERNFQVEGVTLDPNQRPFSEGE